MSKRREWPRPCGSGALPKRGLHRGAVAFEALGYADGLGISAFDVPSGHRWFQFEVDPASLPRGPALGEAAAGGERPELVHAE